MFHPAGVASRSPRTPQGEHATAEYLRGGL